MRFCLMRFQDIVARIACKPGEQVLMSTGELKGRTVADESILIDIANMLGW